MTGQKRYFWLAVTADEYELPLAVEDTAAALARRLGVSENTVRTVEYRGKNERYRRTKKRTDAGLWNPVQGPESRGGWITWQYTIKRCSITKILQKSEA